jgi:hypothetical protein
MTKDWSKFSVGSPSKRQNWTNQSCVPFDSVFHVTHIKNSLTILHDRKIKAGLIFDKSILNLERILVSWLSPNVWGDGYRYGNIRIKFDFNKIIEDKKFYWVESIAYGVPACRILLTDQEHNNLSPYDPSFNDGPWWFDSSSEIHYYNNNYCIEFLVEEDLSISTDEVIDFVTHHRQWCSINRNNPAKCPELDLAGWHASGKFIASVLADSVTFPVQLFHKNESNITPDALNHCWLNLCLNLTENENIEINGTISHTDREALPLSRAICNAFSYSTTDEERVLISMFRSAKDLKYSLAKLISNHFSLSNWRDILNE